MIATGSEISVVFHAADCVGFRPTFSQYSRPADADVFVTARGHWTNALTPIRYVSVTQTTFNGGLRVVLWTPEWSHPGEDVMDLIEPFQRVVVVVLDGLRVDAIDAFALPTLMGLRRNGAYATAMTVEPSVTWTAMTSLMTGVPAAVHGVVSDSIHLPRPCGVIDPLAATLAERGLPTSAVLARIPVIFRGVASAIGRKLGVGHLRFVGEGAADILESAHDRLTTQNRGLILLHWPDADRAGHEHGWMSPAYAEASMALDRALAKLLDIVDAHPDTLVIALADHGGGGVNPKDHESDHPHDRLIPLVFVGAGVIPGEIGVHASLLDVPATILWALGVERPSSYQGTPLTGIVSSSRRWVPTTIVA